MHLRIRLGTEHYALDLDHVLEVVELGEVTPVPGSAPTLIGIRNLRGEILPALDLSALLAGAIDRAKREGRQTRRPSRLFHPGSAHAAGF